MARELITSWGDYQAAIDRLLSMACRKIRIYDEDLGQFKLETASHLNDLKRVVQAGHNEAVRIALRNTDPLRRQHPLLVDLLTTYNHLAAVQQTPPQIAHLRDSIVIVDDVHALIRFEQDQARSKLLIDETDEVRPYLVRFEEIWAEGGEPVTRTTLGL